RITVTNVLGDCRSSSLLYGTRCTTIEGVGTATGNWEAPWQPGSTDTAMTVTATCEVLDERGSVLDSRTTCIPSLGWVDGHAIIPPWAEACQAQLQGCHRVRYGGGVGAGGGSRTHTVSILSRSPLPIGLHQRVERLLIFAQLQRTTRVPDLRVAAELGDQGAARGPYGVRPAKTASINACSAGLAATTWSAFSDNGEPSNREITPPAFVISRAAGITSQGCRRSSQKPSARPAAT